MPACCAWCDELNRWYDAATGRWLSEDPIGFAAGDPNLYRYVGNGVTGATDPSGLAEYQLGNDDTPNSDSLNKRKENGPATFKTLRPAHIGEYLWILSIEQEAMDVANLARFKTPNASRHLRHFLHGTGKELEIDFAEMNRESANAKEHRIKEINDALAAAEKFGVVGKEVEIRTTSDVWANPGNHEGDWLYAVGEYRTWAKATVRCNAEGTYEMDWSFNFRDNYDWNINTNLGAGLSEDTGFLWIYDRDMALLHRYGFAQEFEMVGTENLKITWKKGQRLSEGNAGNVVIKNAGSGGRR